MSGDINGVLWGEVFVVCVLVPLAFTVVVGNVIEDDYGCGTKSAREF
jgi:hypothetical protein